MRQLFIFISLVTLVSCKTQQVSVPDVSNPVVSTTTASITGIEWKLTKMGDTDLSAVNPPVTLKLDDPRKAISGHAGCNSFFGAYLLNGSSITFNGFGSTKMFCDGKMNVESAYFKALGMIQTYKTEGDKLYLLGGDKVVLEFSK